MARPAYDVYTVTNYGANNEKSFWTRIGSGWVNKDGSINVELNALPVNGKINIRLPKAREAAKPSPDMEERAGEHQPF